MSIFSSDSKLMQAFEVIFYLVALGLLWLLLSLTVVGIGPASTALYYAVAKSVKHGRGNAFREFFSALKGNWLNAMLINILLLGFGWIVYAYDWNYIIAWIQTGTVTDTLQTVLAIVKVLLLLGITGYAYPFLSRFQVNLPRALLLSLFCCFRYLWVTVVVIFLLVATAVIAVLCPALSWLLPGAAIWLISYPMEYVLRKFVPEEAEDAEDPWYMEK